MPAKTTAPRVKIWSRTVKLGRGGKAIWGPWVLWGRYSAPEKNIKQAIKSALDMLKWRRTGMIVYVGRAGSSAKNAVPIFHAKFGTDGSRFADWKSNPVGEYWRRRMG